MDGEVITLDSLQIDDVFKDEIKRKVSGESLIELTDSDHKKRIMIYKEGDEMWITERDHEDDTYHSGNLAALPNFLNG